MAAVVAAAAAAAAAAALVVISVFVVGVGVEALAAVGAVAGIEAVVAFEFAADSGIGFLQNSSITNRVWRMPRQD